MELKSSCVGCDLYELIGEQEARVSMDSHGGRATGAISTNGDERKDTGRWANAVASVWTQYLKMVKGAQFELTGHDVAWMVDNLPQERW